MQGHGCGTPKAEGSGQNCAGHSAEDRRLGAERFLSQIKEIDRGIRRKRDKIQRHRDALCLGGVSYSDMPKAPSPPPSGMEEHFCEIGELEWEIAEDMRTRSTTQAEMLIRMAEIEDTRCFMALKGLYVDRKRWKTVGRELGCGDKGVREAKENGIDALAGILERKGEMDPWIRKARG